MGKMIHEQGENTGSVIARRLLPKQSHYIVAPEIASPHPAAPLD
jgi:hypothetical protein